MCWGLHRPASARASTAAPAPPPTVSPSPSASAMSSQTAYVLVANFVAEGAATPRLEHMRRWEVAAAADELAGFRAVAWSPSLPALYRIQLQLLSRCRLQIMNAFLAQDVTRERQLNRALAPLGSRERSVVQVRQLVRDHRVQRCVLLELLDLHPELRSESERLRLRMERIIAVDETSESSSEDR